MVLAFMDGLKRGGLQEIENVEDGWGAGEAGK
jgi:hypothetical protein